MKEVALAIGGFDHRRCPERFLPGGRLPALCRAIHRVRLANYRDPRLASARPSLSRPWVPHCVADMDGAAYSCRLESSQRHHHIQGDTRRSGRLLRVPRYGLGPGFVRNESQDFSSAAWQPTTGCDRRSGDRGFVCNLSLSRGVPRCLFGTSEEFWIQLMSAQQLVEFTAIPVRKTRGVTYVTSCGLQQLH